MDEMKSGRENIKSLLPSSCLASRTNTRGTVKAAARRRCSSLRRFILLAPIAANHAPPRRFRTPKQGAPRRVGTSRATTEGGGSPSVKQFIRAICNTTGYRVHENFFTLPDGAQRFCAHGSEEI